MTNKAANPPANYLKDSQEIHQYGTNAAAMLEPKIQV